MVEYILHKTKEETALNTKKMYVSTPYNRVQSVEERLKKIFDEELKSEGSVLVSYKPAILSKLAKYLSGHISRPASIGIAGETASGKSTITLDIIDTIKSFATEFEIEDVVQRSEILRFCTETGTSTTLGKPLTAKLLCTAIENGSFTLNDQSINNFKALFDRIIGYIT